MSTTGLGLEVFCESDYFIGGCRHKKETVADGVMDIIFKSGFGGTNGVGQSATYVREIFIEGI